MSYIYIAILTIAFIWIGFEFKEESEISLILAIFLIFAMVGLMQVYYTKRTWWLLKFPKSTSEGILDDFDMKVDGVPHKNNMFTKIIGVLLVAVTAALMLMSAARLYENYVIFATSLYRDFGESGVSSSFALAFGIMLSFILLNFTTLIYNISVLNIQRTIIEDA